MRSVDEVDLATSRELIRVCSASSTVYYLDLRGARPMLLRARGAGRTSHGSHDDVWVPLWQVVSGPRLVDLDGNGLEPESVDRADVLPGWLRVGSRHEYTFRMPGALGLDECWWVQRVADRIEILEEMPPAGARSRSADEVDFLDGPEPRAWQEGA